MFGIIFTICQGKIIDRFGTLAGNIFLCVFLLIGTIMTGNTVLTTKHVLQRVITSYWFYVTYSNAKELSLSVAVSVMSLRWFLWENVEFQEHKRWLLRNLKDCFRLYRYYNISNTMTNVFLLYCTLIKEFRHLLTGKLVDPGSSSGFRVQRNSFISFKGFNINRIPVLRLTEVWEETVCNRRHFLVPSSSLKSDCFSLSKDL